MNLADRAMRQASDDRMAARRRTMFTEAYAALAGGQLLWCTADSYREAKGKLGARAAVQGVALGDIVNRGPCYR